MQGGFSFCNTDIYTFGLEYAPEMNNTYVYTSAPESIQEQRTESHEGGYFYGTSVQPKDFSLRCFFENDDVRDGIITQLTSFFRIGRTGKLCFKTRPWCWYTATVIECDTSRLLNYKNGFINIKMRAYYPYARSDVLVIDPYDLNQRDIIRNSAVLTSTAKMPATQYGSANNRITAQTSLLLYNPGTKPAKVAIEIAGTVNDGVIISNATTNQQVKFVAITDTLTTTVGKYVISDALNGKTVLTNGTAVGTQLAFLYHDNGFLELAPAYPILRNVVASHTNGSTSVTLAEDVDTSVIGKYIYLDAAWRKIVNVPTSTTLTISSTPSSTGVAKTEIVTMNEITVSPVSTMSLSKLNFVYHPTFS